ncbi:ABC transporter permease [Emticicia sp.]|uniref:ABC transporter permease n=1 Tax=Emticicia sp. TaxID=1930953 RepID=UPI003752D12B
MSIEKISFKHSITPKDKLFDLRLSDIWRFRDLLSLFVYRDFVAVYKQTILGPIWFFIQPLFTTIVYTVIFSKVAKISTDGLPPLLFYLAGVSSWNYFSACFSKTSNSFTENAQLFGKVYFPRVIVPLSVVVSNLLTFSIQFLLFILLLGYYLIKGVSIHPNIYILLLPILVLIMAFMGLGFGMLVSALTTKYRDLQFLVTFGIQLAMYATPVIYPTSVIPAKYQWIMTVNPMASIIETFRYAFLGVGSFSWEGLLYSLTFTFTIFSLGLIIFNNTEKNFMDTV